MKHYFCSIFLFLFSTTFLQAQDSPVEVTSNPDPNGTKNIEFYAENANVGKFIVRVKFPRLVNLRSTTGISDFVGTVGPGRSRIFALRPLILNRPIDYSYEYSSHRGCHRVKLKEDIVYLLPFKSKEQRYIYDNDDFIKANVLEKDAHEGLEAMTIMMKENEVVYSSRRGLVVEVQESYDDMELIDSVRQKKRNYITIQHDDCSFSRYEYLQKDGVIPTVGDRVDAGQLIASVGGKPYEKGYRLKYLFYYVDYDHINDKVAYHYFKPKFRVDGEVKEISSGGLYTSDHSIDLIIQEMSKREKNRLRN